MPVLLTQKLSLSGSLFLSLSVCLSVSLCLSLSVVCLSISIYLPLSLFLSLSLSVSLLVLSSSGISFSSFHFTAGHVVACPHLSDQNPLVAEWSNSHILKVEVRLVDISFRIWKNAREDEKLGVCHHENAYRQGDRYVAGVPLTLLFGDDRVEHCEPDYSHCAVLWRTVSVSGETETVRTTRRQ